MNTNLNMQTMPIDRLKPAKYNPRKDLKPGDPAYEKIKRSLHDFGYVDGFTFSMLSRDNRCFFIVVLRVFYFRLPN